MRVKAPVCYRPAKRRLARRQVIDLGLGGMRVYSDEAFRIGTRFEVDLFLPDDSSITCLTEVVWIHPIDGGRPANFDVGLRFLDIPPGDRERLGQVLEGE
jgi:Tfp pilus assembly protein PilZ